MRSNYRYAILLLLFNVIACAYCKGSAHHEEVDKALLEGALMGRYSVVNQALKKGASLQNATDEYRRSALHLAAWRGHLDLVKLFLSLPSSDEVVNAQDLCRRTPLHQAATYGHLSIVKLLVQHGALLNIKDHEGWTPLFATLIRAAKWLYQSPEYRRHHINYTLELLPVISYLINSGASIDAKTEALLAKFPTLQWQKEKEAYYRARKQEIMTLRPELPAVLADLVLDTEAA